MSNELIYNPLEDKDKDLPVYKNNGKNLIMPAFICGVKIKDIKSRSGDDLRLAELQFEIHESAEKMEVDIFPKDDEDNYLYRSDPEEKVSGSVFVGKRVRSGNNGTIWKNNTKGSGKMNKILLQTLKGIGVEIKTKKVETDGKKVQAEIIPEITEELLLGKPVFIWLDEESYTSKNGNNVKYICANKYTKIDGVDDVDVMENSLKQESKPGSNSSDQQDPFGDIDDDLPF